MRRDWHPYAYRAYRLVRRADLSHINLFGTRADMLIGGFKYAYNERAESFLGVPRLTEFPEILHIQFG